MNDPRVMLITGARKGIGRFLAEHYTAAGWQVVGCSRRSPETEPAERGNYLHECLDVSDEAAVVRLLARIRSDFGRLDVLINNAAVASMNHTLLTPYATAEQVMRTNYLGTFVSCREAAKLMQKAKWGRIVNLTTIAVVLKLAGEAVYASSKAAVTTFTEIFAREVAPYGITVNAVGPAPTKTDLIRSVPEVTIKDVLSRQAIPRYGEFRDVLNVIDFFIRPESDFVTGQTIFLGGV